MSLVVLSNQPQDAEESRNRNSISKPWSFKNTLTSTYTIPEDAQVALTSCKVNIPERVTVGGNDMIYQYIGVKRDLAGNDDQYKHSTSWPVEVRFNDDNIYDLIEQSPAGFANYLEFKLRATTYHPNYKTKTSVVRKLDSSTNRFNGYSITYDQSNSGANASNIPTEAFKQWYSDDEPYSDTAQFTYSSTTKSFARIDTSGSGAQTICAGINPQHPLSMASGEFVVNVSGTAEGNANENEVEWHVGLSRYIHQVDPSSREYKPTYDDTEFFGGDNLNIQQDIYADFAVCRNEFGQLVAYQYVRDADERYTRREVKYWLNTNSSYAGTGRATSASLADVQRVKFEVEGEVVKVELYDGTDYRLVTKYAAGQRDDSYFKPVNQNCWCLHPVLAIGRKAGQETSTLQIREYQGIDITGYDPTKKNGGGWYENNLVINRENDSYMLDIRPVNGSGGGPDGASYVQKELNASGGVDYKPVLILGANQIYNRDAQLGEANGQDLLGYDKSVVETGDVDQVSLVTFGSTVTPSLAPQYSMFVRLNNLGQDVTNGLIGNKSKIIAHLTTFENATGKLTYEPATLTYLDLNNSAPITLSEFDISFCYVNEQFAEALAGQSIVTLHIRKKPRELK
jgi:hypothetical protein